MEAFEGHGRSKGRGIGGFEKACEHSSHLNPCIYLSSGHISHHQ